MLVDFDLSFYVLCILFVAALMPSELNPLWDSVKAALKARSGYKGESGVRSLER